MGRMTATRAMALAMCAACYCGAHVFLMPASRRLTDAPKLAPGRSPSLLTSAEGTRPTPRSSGFSAASPVLLSAFLVSSAVAVGRQARRRTARRVTYQEIDKLGLDDVPTGFVKNISIAKSRRNFYKEMVALELEDTFAVMAWNHQGTTWKEKKEFRDAMPIGVKARMLDNSLVVKALEGTDWEPMAPACRGQLMYIFIKEDNQVAKTVQAMLKLTKSQNRQAVLDQCFEEFPEAHGAIRPMANSFAMFADEWNLLDDTQIPKLKDFPSRETLVTRIAVGIKQVTTKLAKGVKQVPQKLAIGIKETAEKGEKEGKGSIGEVTP